MQYPGDTWTIVSASALAAWGVAGTAYLKTRLLAPVREGAARATHQAVLSRSSPDRLTKKALLSKARTHIRNNDEHLRRAARWQTRVYTPVLVALSATTLLLTVWGLL